MKNFIFAAVMICVSFASMAQKVIKEEGDLSFLKNEKSIKLEYVFDGMGVGKFDKEEDYVKDKVETHNAKEAGKGDKWLEGWKSARKNRYQPKFEELLNKYLSEKDIIALPSKTTAKYTLILKTTFIEPGFNIGIMRVPASINVEYIFVDTANPEKVLAKYITTKIPGQDALGYDFDAGVRIAEAYAKAGKIFSKYMLKELK